MNLGKSYIKAPLSEEQRLEEVERKFDVILEKIQRYDEVLDKFVILQKELYNLASKQKTMEEKANQALITHDVQLSGISSQLKQSDFQQRNLGSNFSELGKKVDSNKEEMSKKLSELLGNSERLKNEIVKCENRFVLNVRFDELLNHIDKEFDFVKNEIFDVQKQDGFKDQKISNHSAKISELENRFNAQNLDLIHKKFEASLDAHKKATKDDILTAMTISTNRMLDLKDSLQIDLSNMKKEILGTPSALETTRKEIMNKLEMTSLDATNATIKTGNAQKKLDLLEKKIEMINLIMQKNDIK